MLQVLRLLHKMLLDARRKDKSFIFMLLAY